MGRCPSLAFPCTLRGRTLSGVSRSCRHTLELDPLNPLMHAHLAWHYYMAREFAEALVQSEHVIRMEPSFHWGHFFAGWALERLGRHGEAITSLREAVRCSNT